MSLLQVTRMLRVSEFLFSVSVSVSVSDPSPCPEAVDFLFFRKAVHANAQLFCSLGPQDRENRQPLSRERVGVRAAATSDVVFTTVSLTMTKLRS